MALPSASSHHAAAFETDVADQLVGRLNPAAAARQAAPPEFVVADALPLALEIPHEFADRFLCRGVSGLHATEPADRQPSSFRQSHVNAASAHSWAYLQRPVAELGADGFVYVLGTGPDAASEIRQEYVNQISKMLAGRQGSLPVSDFSSAMTLEVSLAKIVFANVFLACFVE